VLLLVFLFLCFNDFVLLDLHCELTAFLVLQMLKDISELKAKLTEVFSCLMTGNLIAYYAF
jgi:hypothetical protein